ncbi:hypothetical protein DSM03_108124 [Leeuwenhoekiella aestuarii]|uniref:Amino acid permease n=1 Tax=Leeuwenhoekiella aestuarii TaxID=2249426 RepID=A0A4Q0NQX4_9FLAO|nr:APC family permease [Leeuwenhoekiella aestuarii]RXG12978.1 hypothetical protein DSM03_108124 [Leeuwenhoekiella aestuarii]RXG13042.1 hypothetical protein DSM04_10519 [Leeuwenhoekiella aestuarii]
MGSKSSKSLGVLAVWALAAGGMVGGGIYTVLGVVIAVSAQWAWLAFLLTGLVALPSAYSYVFLTKKFHKEGGVFVFLEAIKAKNMAGNLAWMLILGYVLTISVYAFAFGHYVSFAFNFDPLITRLLALTIVASLVVLNLAGVGKLSKVEIAIVSVNLIVLFSLAIYGIINWDPNQLVSGIEPRPFWSSLIGGAAIFMAYEGFQLLTYEYSKIKKPKKYLMPTLLSAVGFVVILYILVALGATMLGGALSLVRFKEIALSISAQNAFGKTGIIVMTIAAAFATAAAINSTLFSTANLSKRIAKQNELPSWFNHTNTNDVPDRSIILLGALAAGMAVIGSLSSLVEAASLAFLCTFGIVNWIALKESDSKKWIPLCGIIISGIIGLALVFRLSISKPLALVAVGALVLLIVVGRPYLLKNTIKRSNQNESD